MSSAQLPWVTPLDSVGLEPSVVTESSIGQCFSWWMFSTRSSFSHLRTLGNTRRYFWCRTWGGSGSAGIQGFCQTPPMHRTTPAVKSLLDQSISSAEAGRLHSPWQVDPCGPKLIIWSFKTIPTTNISGRLWFWYSPGAEQDRRGYFSRRPVPGSWPSLEEGKNCRATQRV